MASGYGIAGGTYSYSPPDDVGAFGRGGGFGAIAMPLRRAEPERMRRATTTIPDTEATQTGSRGNMRRSDGVTADSGEGLGEEPGLLYHHRGQSRLEKTPRTRGRYRHERPEHKPRTTTRNIYLRYVKNSASPNYPPAGSPTLRPPRLSHIIKALQALQ